MLLYWNKEIPKGSFTEGIVLGCLLAHDYSKFIKAVEFFKNNTIDKDDIDGYSEYMTKAMKNEGKRKIKEEVKKLESISSSPPKESFTLLVTPPNSCSLCHSSCPSPVTLSSCSHIFHSKCITLHLNRKLSSCFTPETCPAKSWMAKIPRSSFLPYLDLHSKIIYDTSVLISTLNNTFKYSVLWWESCRKVYAKKRGKEREWVDWGEEGERLREVIKEKRDRVVKEWGRQVHRWEKWFKWKHKFENTVSWRCKWKE